MSNENSNNMNNGNNTNQNSINQSNGSTYTDFIKSISNDTTSPMRAVIEGFDYNASVKGQNK